MLFPDRDYDNRETAEYTFEHTALPEDILLYYFPPDPTLENKNIAEIAGLLEQDAVAPGG